MELALADFMLEDEDIMEHLKYLVRPRRLPTIRERTDHFERWDNYDFFLRFRLSKETVYRIVNEIGGAISSNTNRNRAISPVIRFYATRSFLIAVGDFMEFMSTASKAIYNVSRALAQLRSHYIKMPNINQEILKIRQEFFNKARFPRCISALDCSHAKIQLPGATMRKRLEIGKFFSFNVQTIAGPDLRIQNIVALWPGSVHDSIYILTIL